jgi:hypothetical protein
MQLRNVRVLLDNLRNRHQNSQHMSMARQQWHATGYGTVLAAASEGPL